MSPVTFNRQVFHGPLPQAKPNWPWLEESYRNHRFSERVHGRFRRGFRLAAAADLATVNAVHRDGVLTAIVAKQTADEPECRRMPIGKG